ncbi:MAG: colanic acid biosynthesis acetyltransferase WcaF [Crocinitomicaceae bacterium TMED135]|nr:MAG: colanic acid biosynthesis acetyltransferase WcaF [Crocinitomicaceae bacterium TMED135]
MHTDLSKYHSNNYKPGNIFLRFFWYFINVIFFKSSFFPFNFLKIFLLRLFGCSLGKGVVIKPNVNIKYPWKLSLGNYVWIGEQVWIDNLDNVTIGNHVCISQGAILICGSHDYKKPSFDLITKEIILNDGVWVGTKSIILPGVVAESHAILSAGSVMSKNLENYTIYRGNPAKKVGLRTIT